MKFIFMPYQRWDAMYDAMPEEILCPIVIGGNLMACDFEGENQKVRLVRGLESQIGLVEMRMLRNDFDTSTPSVLGTGIVANQMAKELIDEGKVIPQRPVVGQGWQNNRRPAYPAVPTDCTSTEQSMLERLKNARHDEEPKPKRRKKRSKSRTTKKAAKKRKR